MPVDYSKYPSDWKQISQRIRDRAGNCCEQCGVRNHATILRSTVDAEQFVYADAEADCYYTRPDGRWIRMSELPDEFDDAKEIRVVLTVAHLDNDTANNADENLKALCQLHHLRLDAQYHAENSKATRARKKREAALERGQLELFGSE